MRSLHAALPFSAAFQCQPERAEKLGDKSFHHLGIPREWPAGGPGGMLEQVLAEDVRTALRRCAAEGATRRGCADGPGRPGGGRPGCAAAGDQLLVSCGPVKRSIWACCRASASSASEEIGREHV